MLSLIKELFSVLDPTQRRRFYRLQALVILMALAEVVSVAAIGPFMLLLVNIDQIESIEKLNYAYELTQASSPSQFVLYAGIATICVLFITSCISIFTVWRLSMFCANTGEELSNRLFRYYLSRNWLYHSANDSASLSNKISGEANKVTNQILQPLLNLNAKLLLAFGIGIGIFLMEPVVAFAGTGLFLLSYVVIFLSIRTKLLDNSQHISISNKSRFRKQMEGLGGIRDLLLLNRQQTVVNQFQECNHQLAESTGQNNALGMSPRYFMEFVAISAVVLLVVYLSFRHDGNLGNILPILSIYGLAGLKLLPAFQQSFQSISTIKGATASFISIRDDLKQSLKSEAFEEINEVIGFDSTIKLRNLSFSYPDKTINVIDNLSLTIKKNQNVAFVGASGSGKSTLIDLVSGLIEVQSGDILIDDKPLIKTNLKSWQQKIGIVSQNIFIVGSSIRENIAFGLPENEIDNEKIYRALNLAHLSDFIETLDEGIYTNVGERGAKLSGGQRQRIGIARALYNEPEILIFDEATSALDGISERIIMDTINKFQGSTTIITIAHRLTTVRNSDVIYMLNDGNIVDQGTYDVLINSNKTFKSMANSTV